MGARSVLAMALRLVKSGSVAVLGPLAVLVLAGCGGSSRGPSGCVAVPSSLPNGRMLAQSQRRLTVPVGAIVWVALVQSALVLPGSYKGPPYPQSFPWLAARSSDPTVLRSVRLCPSTSDVASSLPVVDYGFRAVAAGTASVTAPLRPAWRGRTREVRPYRGTVVVRH